MNTGKEIEERQQNCRIAEFTGHGEGFEAMIRRFETSSREAEYERKTGIDDDEEG